MLRHHTHHAHHSHNSHHTLSAYAQSFSLSSLNRLSIATFTMKFTLPLVALSLGTALGAVIHTPGANTVCACLSFIIPMRAAS